MRNAHKILVQYPEGKRSFRRRRLRWEDDITMDVRETVVGKCVLDSSGSG
jgi:hypothetical protein